MSYFRLCSNLILNRYHKTIRNIVHFKEKELDSYPTFYRANTISKLNHLLKKYHFEGIVLGHNPEPAYLLFNKFLYRLGIIYNKISPRWLAVNLFVFARKKTTT
ncbi:hypothetical protein A946_11585 [Methylacidiphilum kamchatkense Kam1]|uniref:Uncharacterized protein n=1 Tax=Methylacidiphilum kamchatkense Kam1 TaxID=1202785 RepID=A0ABR4ZU11_9BACT|nr:hypothetical protein A946_11585 [Methylacidiphilum kamchatkense Kam1]